MLLIAGMFLDAMSIYLIFLPLLVPLIARRFQWDLGLVRHHHDDEPRDRPVHPAAGGQPDGDLRRSPRFPWRSTVRWVIWFVAAMTAALLLVMSIPDLVLWLPRRLGY